MLLARSLACLALVPPLAFLTAPPLRAQRGAEALLRAERLADVGLSAAPIERIPRQRIARRDLRLKERPAILLTGYWPPSNEAVRRFSTDPIQNPEGWIGENWEGRGYDVHSFFPEFADPMCISCGPGMGDLEVDYQDTSSDFWPIADALQPIAILTFSRGGSSLSWEVEMNQYNRSVWISDELPPTQPTPSPPNPDAPANSLIQSSHAVDAIVSAVAQAGLGLDPALCWSGDGGGYLSEFIAYHGVWYQSLHDDPQDTAWCAAAGHVHVGGAIDWATGAEAVKVTLRTVIAHVDVQVDPGLCQADLGFGGPGSARLAVCGEPLTAGAKFDLLVSDATPSAIGWLVLGPSFAPTPLGVGHLVPVPASSLTALLTSPIGTLTFFDLHSPGGPATLYAQYVYVDTLLPGFFGMTNAVRLEFL